MVARLVAVLIAVSASCASAQVVVEEVATPSAAARAGLIVGDRLISWTRVKPGAVVQRGRFRSPFDAREFEIEQLPRGGTRVAIDRAGRRLVMSLGPGPWGIEAGLGLSGSLGRQYAGALAKARRKDVDGAAVAWRAVAVELAGRDRVVEAAWLHSRIGTVVLGPVSTGFFKTIQAEGSHVDMADAAFAEGVALARQIGDPRVEAFVQEAAGAAWGIDVIEPWRASLGRIRKIFAEALRLRSQFAPGSLAVAASQTSLAASWAWSDDPKERPDWARAIDLYDQAIALRTSLAAESHDQGLSRLMLALLLFEHGSPERANTEARAATAILRRTAPGTHALELSAFIGSLLAGDRGDYLTAVNLYAIALPIARRRPDFERKRLLDDRSLILLASGEMARADAALRRYLVTTGAPPVFLKRVNAARDSTPTSELNRYVMLDFGRYADELGNQRSAAVFLRLALNSSETQPGRPIGSDEATQDVACSTGARLIAIGEATPAETARFDSECREWGTLARTRDPYGEYLLLLARAEIARGRIRPAMKLAAGAVRLRRKSGIKPWLAAALRIQGEALCKSSATGEGVVALEEAGRLHGQYAPHDRERVATLTALGSCLHQAGRLAPAAARLKEAMTILRTEPTGSIKPSDQSRAFETATLADTYEELAGVLMDLHRPEEAFQVTEWGRARAFRKMLAERNLTPSGPKWALDIHDTLRPKRERLWINYDKAQGLLDETPPGVPAERDRRLARLHAIALQIDAMESIFRTRVPHVEREAGRQAGLEPASVDEIASALGTETALVEYAVTATTTRVFLIDRLTGRARLRTRTLPIGRAALGQKIDRLRHALQAVEPDDAGIADALGKELYTAIVGPIESLIAASAKILVIPDGPLHALPFGALVRTAESGAKQYLVEWKPLHIAPSASGYVLLRGMPSSDPQGSIVAFGDPTSSEGGQPAGVTRDDVGQDEAVEVEQESDSAKRSGNPRLPGSRREVRAIVGIMGPSASAFVGAEASESRIKALPPTTRLLHFATHATVNLALTANSGLRLAKPATSDGRDNGYLQAWEIADQLRIRADLVTLSSCDSASGRTLAGEGVMSLARAFHYAGARSVVSTLWRIDDSATADLMAAFYWGLKAGMPKDEALRQAQVGFIRSSADTRRRHPSYWAAFQLSGDWR